ncbi:MAG: acetolactate decarboxylase [Psychroflexus sp.]
MKILVLSLFFAFGLNIQAQVQSAGKAMNVMKGISLENHIDFDSIPKTNLFALAPASDLQGEVTIFDGKIIHSEADKQNILTKFPKSIKTPFSAYAKVDNWIKVTADVDVKDVKSLQNQIEIIAKANDINLNMPFVFKIEAKIEKLDFHIIQKDLNEKAHSHDLHKKSKTNFTRTYSESILLGFYSQHHQGIFTHKGEFVHIHYLSKDLSETGHLDALRHSGKIDIYFSKF